MYASACEEEGARARGQAPPPTPPPAPANDVRSGAMESSRDNMELGGARGGVTAPGVPRGCLSWSRYASLVCPYSGKAQRGKGGAPRVDKHSLRVAQFSSGKKQVGTGRFHSSILRHRDVSHRGGFFWLEHRLFLVRSYCTNLPSRCQGRSCSGFLWRRTRSVRG